METLDPIRERYLALQARPGEVRDRLDQHGRHCRRVAADTMLEVREKMGLSKVWMVQS